MHPAMFCTSAGCCTVCGHKGATLRYLSWRNHGIGATIPDRVRDLQMTKMTKKREGDYLGSDSASDIIDRIYK